MLTKNEKKLIKSLHQKKYRDLHGLFIVEGEKSVNELLDSGIEVKFLLALQRESNTFHSSTVIDDKEMSSLSLLKTAPGILAVAIQPKAKSLETIEKSVLLLDNLKDPGNLGTIIRTAEWFGISHIILGSECVEAYNPKTVQSTMGSLFRMNLFRENLTEAVEYLKSKNFKVYGAEMEGENYEHINWSADKALIIGSESHGISKELSALIDHKITIPGSGQAESLNAAVAASIIISNW